MAVVLAVAALLVSACTTAIPFRPAAELPIRTPAEIDSPAADRAAPADAVVDVRAVYGARGDGRTDDTIAIQAAISNSLGFGPRPKVLYFPAGTYLISRPLLWQRTDGAWSTWLTLQGQNRDRTVLKLADGAPGFNDRQQPRAVVTTGSQNADSADGSGNQAFHNFLFDLTVDVGSGNWGADGIDFLANNRGAIRNVVVRAPAGSGNTGVSMTRKWPGPAQLEDLRIDGFDRGLSVGRSEYSISVFELRLNHQRVVGIENRDNVLTVDGVVSRNAVPAIRNSKSTTSGLLTVVDADLTGGTEAGPAIDSPAPVYLRSIRTDGYGSTVRTAEGALRLSDAETWSSLPPASPFSDSAPSPLEYSDTPPRLRLPPDRWVGVEAFGARRDDDRDDTDAIQASLDSGFPIVYFGSGAYRVSRPLVVPSTVREIVGFDARIDATRGHFAGTSDASVFSIQAGQDPVTVSQLFFTASDQVTNFERLGGRTLSVIDTHFNGRPFRGSEGALYLTDVEGGGTGWTFTPGQQIWARQFNTESSGTKITTDGADLRIVGLKTEGPSTVLAAGPGSRTEVLGGLLYPVNDVPRNLPAFIVRDAAVSAVVATSANRSAGNYQVLAEVTRGGEIRRVSSSGVTPRGGGSVVAPLQIG